MFCKRSALGARVCTGVCVVGAWVRGVHGCACGGCICAQERGVRSRERGCACVGVRVREGLCTQCPGVLSSAVAAPQCDKASGFVPVV